MTAAQSGTPPELTVELRDYVRFLRGLWWVPATLALAGLMAGWTLAPAAPWESLFRAAVILPGDTEDPGSSERPELMILDDLLSLVQSRVFAERTFDAIPAGDRGDLTVTQVQAALDETRYGRVATVIVSGPDQDEVAAIVSAAAAVFPEAVNAYLVAPGAQPASVQELDPPSEPERSFDRRSLTIGTSSFVSFMAGMWIVWFLGATKLRGASRSRATQPGTEPDLAAKNPSR